MPKLSNKIFDNYYQKLSNQNDKTEGDNSWKMCLARMDRRKMTPTVEEKNGQHLIKFNPEIEPYLKKHSEDTLKMINERNKYLKLQLWAKNKLEKKEEHKNQDYLTYESNPKVFFKTVRYYML